MDKIHLQRVKKTLALLKRKAVPLLRKSGVERSYLFGSHARGENKKKSDIDLLVRYYADEPASLFTFAHLKLELEKKLGKKVDLVMEEGLKPLLKPYLKKDQILLL